MKRGSVLHAAACAIAAASMIALFAVAESQAVQPDEILSDPKLEARARALSQRLRCVVCQNQTIDDSNAPLARDLRIIVRERLSEGDNDEQVVAYLVARYGNFVLLRPPLQANTLLLWFGPLVIVLVAGAGLISLFHRRSQASDGAPVQLTAEENERLQDLLGKSKPS